MYRRTEKRRWEFIVQILQYYLINHNSYHLQCKSCKETFINQSFYSLRTCRLVDLSVLLTVSFCFLYFVDPPIVSQISQLNIEEERDLSFNCTFTQGNPASTTIFWTSKDKPEFRQNGTTLLLPEIKRSDSGNYTCTAENKYSSGKKGSDSKSMILNVLCKSKSYLFRSPESPIS